MTTKEWYSFLAPIVLLCTMGKFLLWNVKYVIVCPDLHTWLLYYIVVGRITVYVPLQIISSTVNQSWQDILNSIFSTWLSKQPRYVTSTIAELRSTSNWKCLLPNWRRPTRSWWTKIFQTKSKLKGNPLLCDAATFNYERSWTTCKSLTSVSYVEKIHICYLLLHAQIDFIAFYTVCYLK